MHTCYYLALALFCGAVVGCTTLPSEFEANDQFIRDVSVIDVETGLITDGQTIVVRGSEIYGIYDSDKIDVPPTAITPATGGFAIPGLWDMHVHAMSDAELALDYNFPLFVANGIVGIRDMGSVVDGVVETRSRIDQNDDRLAPQIYAAGPLLDGQALPWYGDLPLVLSSPEDANRELPKLRNAGIDFFKVYDGLSADTYQAILAYGRENDVPVAGHVPKSVTYKTAAMSGQRTFEHLSPFSFGDCLSDPNDWFSRGIETKYGGSYDAYYAHIEDLFAALDRQTCQDVYETMSANGTYFAPTLVMELNDRSRVPAADLAFIAPDFRDWCEQVLSSIDAADSERRERVYRQFSDTLIQMQDTGITLLAGSDMPNNCLVPGFSLHWELERLVEAGVSPLEALRAATIHAATAMDREDEIGQLRPGFAADILLLNANPLDQISNTRTINGIMLNGRWIDASDRAEILNSVKAQIDSMRVQEQADQ